jgi:hypothetical protein
VHFDAQSGRLCRGYRSASSRSPRFGCLGRRFRPALTFLAHLAGKPVGVLTDIATSCAEAGSPAGADSYEHRALIRQRKSVTLIKDLTDQ